jgi:uncharacterized RDD family membrane protein YckC
MSQDSLIIQSVTGVDVEFQIAGAGSRSYAFVIDWHIRVILALAWLIVAWIAIAGGLTFAGLDAAGGGRVAAIFLPPVIIYVFYQPLAELVTSGRSPGKRMAGVRLITRSGDVPGIGALLIRNLFRLVDSLPAFYVIGLVCAIVTKDHVRIGDMAAGTLLVIDHDHEGKSLARAGALGRNPGIDPKTADLIDELIERWKSIGSDKRRDLAVALLSRTEPGVDRQRLESLADGDLLDALQRVLTSQSAT